MESANVTDSEDLIDLNDETRGTNSEERVLLRNEEENVQANVETKVDSDNLKVQEKDFQSESGEDTSTEEEETSKDVRIAENVLRVEDIAMDAAHLSSLNVIHEEPPSGIIKPNPLDLIGTSRQNPDEYIEILKKKLAGKYEKIGALEHEMQKLKKKFNAKDIEIVLLEQEQRDIEAALGMCKVSAINLRGAMDQLEKFQRHPAK